MHFGSDYRANPTQRLSADQLARIIGAVVEPLPGEEDREYGWRLARTLRYLRHFYDAAGGRLQEDEVRALSVQDGYDPGGVAGPYEGTASLRIEGSERVLTETGRQFYEENRHHLD